MNLDRLSRWMLVAVVMQNVLVSSESSAQQRAGGTPATTSDETIRASVDTNANTRVNVKNVDLADTRLVTPAEYVAALEDEKFADAGMVRESMTVLTLDSTNAVATAHAREWLARLAAHPGTTNVTGLQLDAMGHLCVVAGDYAKARMQFAARLATSELSADDRAYTLSTAVAVFAKASRFDDAVAYQQQLDRLPVAHAEAQFLGHSTLAHEYLRIGDRTNVLVHATAAFARVPSISYEYRTSVFGSDLLLLYALATSRDPTGPRLVDSVSAMLLAAAEPPPGLAAKAPRVLSYAAEMRGLVREAVAESKFLGQVAPPIVATQWYNMPAPMATSPTAPGATVASLQDGMIHLLEFGDVSCGFCQNALPAMQALARAKLPGVSVMYVTQTEGYWGSQLVSPQEETQHLFRYYVTRKGIDFPIAVWAGPKDPTEDGGVMPRESPTFAAYRVQGMPWFFLIDGQGRVRYIHSGYSPASFAPLKTALYYLVAERAHADTQARAQIHPGE